MKAGIARIYWLDNLKSIGVLLVILSHMSLDYRVTHYLHSFGLPLFFFASGYLFNRSRYTPKQFLWKKVRTLLVPYFFFAIVSFLFWFFVVRLFSIEGRSLLIDPFKAFLGILYGIGSGPWKNPLNIALWFFPCLFVVEMLYYLSKDRWYLIASFAILGYLTYWLPFRLPFSSDAALTGTVFYALGQVCKDRWLPNKYLPLLIIFHVGFCILNTRADMNNLIFGNMLYYYISAVAGVLIYAFLFKLLKPNKLFNYIGKNTVVIIGMEGIIWFVMNAVHYALVGTKIQQSSLLFGIILAGTHIILSIPAIYLVNTFLPFLLGKVRTETAPIGLITPTTS